MIIPSTSEAALMLAILAMFCLGSWAITFKMAGKWRYELFYFDFAFGALLAAAVAALTFGSMGDELSFWDNLSLTAGKRNVGYGFVAGILLNLGNMLALAALSIAGMSVALPITFGVSFALTALLGAWYAGQGLTAYLIIGSLLLVGAALLSAVAYRAHSSRLAEEERERSKATAAITEPAPESVDASDPRSYRRRKKKEVADQDAVGTPAKAIGLALAAGLAMGSIVPLLENSRETELGLGPYALLFVMALGVFLSTIVLNLYFMNLPVKGAPLQFFRYFQGTAWQHLCGVLGGMVWLAGLGAALVLAAIPKAARSGSLTVFLAQAAPLLALLWGVMIYREFRSASGFVNGLLALLALVLAAGLGALSLT